jgi:uncharacterized glyoxalase superfamily protein PhnB
MPAPASPHPWLARAVPVVFVRDVSDAAKFYREALGFSIDFLHGDPPFYGSVSRDGACLHLKFVHDSVIVPGPDDREAFIIVFVEVEHVDALFAEYVAASVSFAQRPRDQSWGWRDFIVRDPDGNMICFAGHGTGPASTSHRSAT